jgi:tetratricopeptide (TPR) repeat protein
VQLLPADPRGWLLLAEAQLRSRQLKEAGRRVPGQGQATGSRQRRASGLPRPPWPCGTTARARRSNCSTQGLKRDPRNASAYFDLGNAHILLNQPRQALAAFERATRLRKDFWEAINNQALVLYEQGEVDRAIERWRRVLDHQSGRR